MSESTELAAPEEEVRQQVQALVAEVGQLRAYKRPPPDADPRRVHEAMLEVRGYLDRLEYQLSELVSMRAACRITVREAETAYQEAWDRQATQPRRGGLTQDYMGKEERYAQWNLDTIKELRALRQAQKVADLVSGVEEQVRLHYRGLNSVQDELKTTLRFLPWISSMEQT